MSPRFDHCNENVVEAVGGYCSVPPPLLASEVSSLSAHAAPLDFTLMPAFLTPYHFLSRPMSTWFISKVTERRSVRESKCSACQTSRAKESRTTLEPRPWKQQPHPLT